MEDVMKDQYMEDQYMMERNRLMKERKRQIAEVEEEIVWLGAVQSVFYSTPERAATRKRIRAREQKALDALKGWAQLAEVARLSAPVSDEEWNSLQSAEHGDDEYVCTRDDFNKIIAARKESYVAGH
jgi:hypothetical protein